MRRALLFVLAMTLLAPAGAAHAGTYTVHSCRGPDGSFYGTDGWAGFGGSPAGFAHAGDACATGGGLFGFLDAAVAHPVGAQVGWAFHAPEGTEVASYRFWRYARAGASEPFKSPVYWFAWPLPQYDTPNVKEQCGAFGACPGDPAQPFGASNLMTTGSPVAQSGVRQLSFAATCGGGAGSTCDGHQQGEPGRITSFAVFGSQIELRDTRDPVIVGSPTGALVEPGRTQSGNAGVTVNATDGGGGLRELALEVDGKVVSTASFGDNDGRCVAPYRFVVPCKAQGSATATLDTTRLGDGKHDLRLLVRDVSGNQAVDGPRQIVVQNAPPTECDTRGALAQPGVALSAAIGPRSRASVTVSQGRGAALSGRVTTPAGRPLGGVTVYVLEQVARAGEPFRVAGAPVSGADGALRHDAAPGPSRNYRLGVQKRPGDSFLTCSPPVALRTRAAGTIRVRPRTTRRGGRVRISGELRGGYLPGNGKLVDVQAFERGRWRLVGTTRARGGAARYTLAYRFSRRARRASYRLRIRIRAESGYPFTLGYSRVVRLRVR